MESIERQVRELVRRRGVDPIGDPAAVGVLIDEVLAAEPHSEEARREVLDAVAGLGPLQRFLDDPTVEEIWVNGPGRVFVARGGRSELTTTILVPGQVEELVRRALEHSGRRVDLSTPFVDAMLTDGSRLHVAIPDVTREHWAVNIRKFVARAQSLPELITLGTLTPHAARFLEASVAAGLNVIVSGGTQAGKTTLDNSTNVHVIARGGVSAAHGGSGRVDPAISGAVGEQAGRAGAEGWTTFGARGWTKDTTLGEIMRTIKVGSPEGLLLVTSR